MKNSVTFYQLSLSFFTTINEAYINRGLCEVKFGNVGINRVLYPFSNVLERFCRTM